MNYIKCFSRSRSAKNLQTVFFSLRPSGVPVGTRQEVLPRLHICARLSSPLAPGKEYCHGCTFTPVWRPRWHQARSIATNAHLRPFRVSIPSYYTHYSKSRELEFLQWCPLLAARYRLYRVSQILGNCKQM